MGEDGEGYELSKALESLPGVRLSHWVRTRHRRTFTYCKPLVIEPDKAPVELNRLDLKNWTPTSAWLQGLLVGQLREAAESVDAIIVLDQVDMPETGRGDAEGAGGAWEPGGGEAGAAGGGRQPARAAGFPAGGVQDECGGVVGADGSAGAN